MFDSAEPVSEAKINPYNGLSGDLSQMVRKQFLLAAIPLTFLLSLLLEISENLSTQAQPNSLQSTLQISVKLPPTDDRGAPIRTGGGGTRGTTCIQDTKSLVPLIPSSKVGLTVSEYPTFFWYMPQSSAETLKFTLLDGEQVIYETTLPPPKSPGIVKFNLPTQALPPLEVSKTYQWSLTLVCNSEDQSGNVRAGGWVERIEPTSKLTEQLQKATPAEHPAVYAAAGIWHETLTTLAQMRLSQPQDSSLTTSWEELLHSVGLDDVAKEIFVESP